MVARLHSPDKASPFTAQHLLDALWAYAITDLSTPTLIAALAAELRTQLTGADTHLLVDCASSLAKLGAAKLLLPTPACL
jgi:hypothetical protein